jgi:hypothetical protein
MLRPIWPSSGVCHFDGNCCASVFLAPDLHSVWYCLCASVSYSDRSLFLLCCVIKLNINKYIPGTTRKKNVVGLERGALSLVSTN